MASVYLMLSVRYLQELSRKGYKSLLKPSYQNQCEFRKEHRCVDMIFVARQLVEKASEHADKLFLLSVDLNKAYNSIPTVFSPEILEGRAEYSVKWALPNAMPNGS